MESVWGGVYIRNCEVARLLIVAFVKRDSVIEIKKNGGARQRCRKMGARCSEDAVQSMPDAVKWGPDAVKMQCKACPMQ